MSTEHDENIAKEFETTQSEESPTGNAVTSLGKVDPLKGRGLTSPDDPEIKRIQALVGYIEFDTANLPSGGNFYRSDMKIHIRPARVGEIRDFSTMDEQNIKDVDDKLNNMLMMCIKINFGKGAGSYKDLMEEDRIYLLLALRELTFKDGESQLL